MLAIQLRNMGTRVEPSIAERREREHHKKLSSLRDKTEALLCDLGDLDEFDRSGIDAAIAGVPDMAGESPFGGERAAAIITDLAKLREALSDLTAAPPYPPQRGKPQTLRGYVSSGMYNVLVRAGVVEPDRPGAWKAASIIVDILDGNVADKKDRVSAMYNRLSQLR